MNYEQVRKQNADYTVPEALHNEKFEAFAKNYSGEVNGCEAPAWRAFEIAYKNGELHGNTKSDNKGNRRTFGRRSKGRSDEGDDGGEQVGAD